MTLHGAEQGIPWAIFIFVTAIAPALIQWWFTRKKRGNTYPK